MRSLRLPACILSALFLLLSGCGSGVQSGQYVESGSSSHALDKVTGNLDIVRGNRPSTSGQVSGPEIALLYFLYVLPQVKATGSGSRGSATSTNSTFDQSYITKAGTIRLISVWDRANDTVTVGGQRFDRKKGNTFVLIKPNDGTLSVHQLANISGMDPTSVLEAIKKEGKDLSVIQSLQLAKTSNP